MNTANAIEFKTAPATPPGNHQTPRGRGCHVDCWWPHYAWRSRRSGLQVADQLHIFMRRQGLKATHTLIGIGTYPQVCAVHMPMPFTRLVAALVQLAQRGCLPGLPVLDMHGAANHLGAAGQLRQQPVRRDPAVRIGARQPRGAPLDHVRRAHATCHADITGIHLQ